MDGDGLLKVYFSEVCQKIETNVCLFQDQRVGNPANILQKGSVNVWNNDNCQQSFEDNGSNIIVTEKQICAGYVNGGIDSCWVSIFYFFSVMSGTMRLNIN